MIRFLNSIFDGRKALCRGRSGLSWVLSGFVSLGAIGEIGATARPWTLQDSVAVRYVAVNAEAPAARSLASGGVLLKDTSAAIKVSPDGEYFFFVRTWGDLERDAVVSELSLFRSRSVLEGLLRLSSDRRSPLLPLWRIVRRSHAPQEPIAGARWDEDGRAIQFVGVSDAGTSEADRLDVRTGALDAVVTLPASVSEMSLRWFAERGGGLLYETEQIGKIPPPSPRYPAEWVARAPDGSMISDAARALRSGEHVQYAVRIGRAPEALPFLARGANNRQVWLSPDGRRGIGTEVYFDGHVVEHFVRFNVEAGRSERLSRFTPGEYFYTGTQTRQPRPAAFWAEDSQRMILVNVKEISGEGSAANAPSYIVEYDFDSDQMKNLEPLEEGRRRVTAVNWLKPGHEVLVTREADGKPAQGTVYTFVSDGLKSRVTDPSLTARVGNAALPEGLKIDLMQGENEPPQVVASAGTRVAPLTEPDPTLKRVQWQRQEPFQWQEPSRGPMTGGLILPRGYTPGRRVPLVIHQYLYDPTTFQPDGVFPPAAGQALAARGIAVLHVSMQYPLATTQVDEGPIMVTRVESAVDALDRAGIVDPARVAITGFSHSGMAMYYTITHPGRVRLAAAMGADFWGGMYSDYLISAGSCGFCATHDFYAVGAGGPFWQYKSEWLKHDPSFNVDRVVTPLLITAHSLEGDRGSFVTRDTSQMLAVVGAFVLNHKPIDYMYMGYASHIPHRPLERISELEVMVDWMSFWLQGYEDPSPHKAVQYARWRPLRAMQAQSLTQANTTRSLQ